ncbi:hypothetical protein ACFQT0_14770 [Hymenobacter humi]|uniref:Uncharacterized protein n=1 Tax=Hymenobacter humi TaxID=1411620 RepID=A0ABW2U501_9BACT
MTIYRPLPQAEYRWENYRLIPIRYEDREPIRAWRNAQLEVLRQAEPLTAEQQDAYFQRVVLPLFEQEKPGQLLFSLLHHDGGGLRRPGARLLARQPGRSLLSDRAGTSR